MVEIPGIWADDEAFTCRKCDNNVPGTHDANPPEWSSEKCADCPVDGGVFVLKIHSYILA